MNYEDFQKIKDLLDKKNAYMRELKSIYDFGKIKKSYIFSRISNDLYDFENDKTPKNGIDVEITKAIIKHKEELYSLIEKICKEEEIEISKKIDKLDEEIESYEIVKNQKEE